MTIQGVQCWQALRGFAQEPVTQAGSASRAVRLLHKGEELDCSEKAGSQDKPE